MLDKNLWKQPNKRLRIYIKSIKPLKGVENTANFVYVVYTDRSYFNCMAST